MQTDPHDTPKSSKKTIALSMIDELANGQDLNNVDSLNFTQLAKRSFKFSSISNLECVPNLTDLNLSYNSISSLQTMVD